MHLKKYCKDFKGLSCSFCGQDCGTKSELEKHKRVHKVKCAEKATGVELLNQYNGDTFTCGQCDRVYQFRFMKKFAHHLQNHDQSTHKAEKIKN